MKTASLQIITDNDACNIPFEFSDYSENLSAIRLGNCLFSNNGIKINLKSENVIAFGRLKFNNISPIQYDIMGPFKFVPFMQCRHSVYSMMHRIDGQITVNGQQYIFQNGLGYTEGDEGSSFPKRYVWTQCAVNNLSIMLSIADIPLLGFNFTGIIGVVFLDGREYRIATYLGAKIKHIDEKTAIVVQGKYRLIVTLIKKNPYSLNSPYNGRMSRIIHESASCKAYYCFTYNGRTICEFTSDRASFEHEFF